MRYFCATWSNAQSAEREFAKLNLHYARSVSKQNGNRNVRCAFALPLLYFAFAEERRVVVSSHWRNRNYCNRRAAIGRKIKIPAPPMRAPARTYLPAREKRFLSLKSRRSQKLLRYKRRVGRLAARREPREKKKFVRCLIIAEREDRNGRFPYCTRSSLDLYLPAITFGIINGRVCAYVSMRTWEIEVICDINAAGENRGVNKRAAKFPTTRRPADIKE